jgi:hypothetical protein
MQMKIVSHDEVAAECFEHHELPVLLEAYQTNDGTVLAARAMRAARAAALSGPGWTPEDGDFG